MATAKSVTRAQGRLAVLIAAIADLAQVPLLPGYASGLAALPAATLDLAVDFVAALVLMRLMGFHWLLLPTAVLEIVPLAGVLPTWTACTLYVLSRRKAEGRFIAE